MVMVIPVEVDRKQGGEEVMVGVKKLKIKVDDDGQTMVWMMFRSSGFINLWKR